MTDSRRERGQRELFVSGYFQRREGVTTALLDIAIANARRGEQVMFLCRTMQEADRVYHEALRTLKASASEDNIGISEGGLAIRWLDTARGSVTFFSDNRSPRAGFRATVVVMDEVRDTSPETVHAHTVIKG